MSKSAVALTCSSMHEVDEFTKFCGFLFFLLSQIPPFVVQRFRFPSVRSNCSSQAGSARHDSTLMSPTGSSALSCSASVAGACEHCLTPDSDTREAETPLLGSLVWALPNNSSRRSTASSIGESLEFVFLPAVCVSIVCL